MGKLKSCFPIYADCWYWSIFDSKYSRFPIRLVTEKCVNVKRTRILKLNFKKILFYIISQHFSLQQNCRLLWTHNSHTHTAHGHGPRTDKIKAVCTCSVFWVEMEMDMLDSMTSITSMYKTKIQVLIHKSSIV